MKREEDVNFDGVKFKMPMGHLSGGVRRQKAECKEKQWKGLAGSSSQSPCPP